MATGIKEVIGVLDDTLNGLRRTLTNKGADYSGSEDTFKNFRLSESILGIPVKKSITVRLLDKVARIGKLLDTDAKVTTESIEDTLDDLIGYAILLKTAYRHGTSSVVVSEESCASDTSGHSGDPTISVLYKDGGKTKHHHTYADDPYREIGHD